MKLTKLEQVMFNILTKTTIKNTSGKYKAALNRLTNKGIAVKKGNEWKLSMRCMI